MGNLSARRFVQEFMRLRLMAFPAILAVLWSMLSIVGLPAAWACDCGHPPPLVSFEGTAETDEPVGTRFGRDYQFRVERVIGGDVRASEKVRYLTRDGSCGVGPGLVRGGRYRIDAYVSALPGEPRLLFVTLCGGSAQLVAAPDTEEPRVASSSPSPAPSGHESEPNRWQFLVAVVAVGATAGVILRRRGRT